MGSAFTILGGDPIPGVDDQVLIPADFAMYAEAIGHKIVHWVVDQAERDSSYASAVAPVWVASPNALWLKVSGSGGSSVWRTIWSDSGPVSAGIAMATNWLYSSGYVRKINNIVSFTVTAVRKNSTVTMAAYNAGQPGNITGDPAVFTLPTGYWPDVYFQGNWRGNVTDGDLEVNVDGTVELISGTPSGVIAIDENVICSATFMVP
jgi:hypothetical protein